MPTEYLSIAEARERPGLRLLVLRRVPSPWSQAAKAVFRVKGLEHALVERAKDDEEGALEDWTGQDAYPAAMYESERPRSGWAEILLLAERLAPDPPLIPRDEAERALCFGLCHELAGEMGLAWCRRLAMVAPGMQTDPPNPFSVWMGGKYGYTPETAAVAQERVVEVLSFLRDRLLAQRAAGSRFLIGDSLCALDLYWATFCNIVSPLPPELLPMPEAMRPMFAASEPEVLALVDGPLLEHRDFIYREYLELPVQL
jgi:glutathione S-transferase